MARTPPAERYHSTSPSPSPSSSPSLPSPLFARFLAPVVRSTPLGWREATFVPGMRYVREMSGWKFLFPSKRRSNEDRGDLQSTTSRGRETERRTFPFFFFFKKSGKERCDVDRKRGYYPGNLARSYKHGVTTGIGRVSVSLLLSPSLFCLHARRVRVVFGWCKLEPRGGVSPRWRRLLMATRPARL